MTDLDNALSERMGQEPLQNQDSDSPEPQDLPENGQEQAATEGQEPQEPEKDEESEQDSETFADKPELSGRTPEELEEIYQNWQKSYTQKRQKEREEMKQLQQQLEEVQNQHQGGANSKYDAQIQDLRDKRAEVQRRYTSGQMNQEDYARYMNAIGAEELKLQGRMDAEQEYQQQQMQHEDEQYQEQALSAFHGADSRLNPDSPEFDERMARTLAGDMEVILDQYLQENGTSVGFDYQSEIDRLIQEYDQDMEQYVASTVKRSSQAARQQANQARKNVSGSSYDTNSGNKSLDQLLSERM